jgi:hypothetical protein
VLKYRFQWTFPIVFSPHDPKELYIGSNVLMKTANEGQNWQVISPDLTRNDKSKQASSGGPITQDNTSVEYYDTIFTVMESPVTKGLIWVGTDDGLVQLSRDGGAHWQNVTPPGVPEWSEVNCVEASPFDAGTAYVAVTAYKLDDNRPYLFKTTDYGKSWTKIVNGLTNRDSTRVVRVDPNHRGTLIAGTEFGLYLSTDDGANWRSFQLNLPVTQIADVAFQKRENELVVATHGRAFYVFDELPLLYQMTDAVKNESVHLFKPRDTYRVGGGRGFGGGGRGGFAAAGENPPAGAVIQYWLKDRPQGDVKLELLDSKDAVVNTYSSRPPERPALPAGPAVEEEENPFRAQPPARVTANAGMNRFVWNLRYPDATTFPGLIMWAGSVTGPRVSPGTYTVRLTAGGQTQTQTFEVNKDPRLTTTPEDYAKQLSLAMQLRDKLSETNQGVIEIRLLRAQLEPYTHRSEKAVAEAASSLIKKLIAVEEELYQTKNRASEDPLNFPIKINNKLAYVMGVVEGSDNQPTAQSYTVYEELASEANARLNELKTLMTADLAAFNKLIHDQNVPAVQAPTAGSSSASPGRGR